MGRIAGRNMAGATIAYPGAFNVLNSLEVAGIPTMAIGITNPPAGEEYQVYQSRRGNGYRKLIFKEEILVGALLIGDIEGAGVYTGIIRRKMKIKMDLDKINRPRVGIASLQPNAKLNLA
jgi:NAD(P)H-nitrite reductase large subunit